MTDAIRAAQAPPDGVAYVPPAPGLAALLRERRAGSAPYLIAYDGMDRRHAYTYAEFAERVEGVARLLHHGLGLRRGDRVATVLHNAHAAVFIYFACWRLGLTVVPINVEETAQRKQFILNDAAAKAVFVLHEFLEQVLALRPALPALQAVLAAGHAPQTEQRVPRMGDAVERYQGHPVPPEAEGVLADEALIVYTSGTTGHPKGVVLNQFNLLADADAIVRCFGLQADDTWMCVLPVHHVNGIVVTLLSPFYAGAGVVLNRRFSPAHFWQRLAAEGCRISSVVPTLLEFLLEAGDDLRKYDLSRLQGLICGAGPLLVETVLRFEERFGVRIYHGYGLSETTAYACMTPLDLTDAQRRFWYREYGFPTFGAPMPHQDLTIRSADGTPAPAGVRGEICVRGATVMQGYYRRDDANAEAFVDGWFRTGDKGFWQPGEGGRRFFFITGRLKELIIRGGVNLSPLEIDDALRSHPAVQFGMAVPFENRWYGEEVAAYVVLRNGYQAGPALADELKTHCRGRLSFPLQPKVICFGTEVPFTSTGKPKRIELRHQLAEQLAPYRNIQFRAPRR